MNFSLAFSSNAFTRFSLHEAIRSIAECGYQGIEILCDTPHGFLDSLDSEYWQEIRELLDSVGLRVSNLNVNTACGYGLDREGFEPSLIHPNVEKRAMRIRYIQHALQLAPMLNCDSIAITTGKLQGGQHREQAWEYLQQGLIEVLSAAEQMAVRVGIEYEPDLFIENHCDLLKCIRSLNHPLLGANLDIGHAVVAGEDPLEVIQNLKGRIWHVHLEDIRGAVHKHLIPGEGDIDFEEVISCFHSIGYDRFLAVELYDHKENPAAAARAAHQFLNQFIS